MKPYIWKGPDSGKWHTHHWRDWSYDALNAPYFDTWRQAIDYVLANLQPHTGTEDGY